MHTTFNAFILAANFIQMYHVDVLLSRPMKIIFIFMPLRVLTFRPHPSFFIFIASWPSYSVIARHSFLLCPVLIARVDQTLEMTEKTASYYASTTVRIRPPPLLPVIGRARSRWAGRAGALLFKMLWGNSVRST